MTAREPRALGRPPRSTAPILDAALALLDEQGADALTFRSLAASIAGSTATLYRHFGTRAELARRIVDHAFAEIALDDARLAARWDEAVTHLAEQLFALLVRHPALAPLMLRELPTGPHALALRDAFRSILIANGFTDVEATLAYATVARFVLGLGMQLGADTPAAQDPGAPGSMSLHQEFAYGLSLMISGLRARYL